MGASSLEECKVLCEGAVGCRSVTFFKNGWCTHYSTPCTHTKSSKMGIVAQLIAQPMRSKLYSNVMFEEQDSKKTANSSLLQGVGDICLILMIVHLFNVFRIFKNTIKVSLVFWGDIVMMTARYI